MEKRIWVSVVIVLVLVILIISAAWGMLYGKQKETNLELSTANQKLTAVSQELRETVQLQKTTEQKLSASLETLKGELNTARQKLAAAEKEAGEIEKVKQQLETAKKESYKLENELKKIQGLDPTLFLPSPKAKGRLDFETLKTILHQQLFDIQVQQAYREQVFIRSSAELLSIEDIQGFLAVDGLNKIQYSTNGFNCTEYSAILYGRERRWAPASAFGIAIVVRPGIEEPNQYHFLNFFIDDKREVWLVEPQYDWIFKPQKTWRYLLASF